MCKSDAPDPPDYSQLADAANRAADLAFESYQDQLAFAREQDSKNRAILNRVLDVTLPIQEDTSRQAKEDRQYLISTFRPLELQQVQEAQKFDTAQRREQEAGAAVSEVAQAFEQSRKASEERLKSFGIDPSQGAFAALQAGSAIEKAKAQASAARAARNRVEDVGRALRADAVNLGRGLPSSIAGSYGTAISAGSSAVGSATNVSNTTNAARATAGGFLNSGISAINSGVNVLNTSFQNALASDALAQQGQSDLFGGIGSLLGAGLGFGAAGGFKGLFGADGGVVPYIDAKADGGVISGVIRGKGDGSGIDDAIKTKAEVGTFIIPKDVVDKVGKKNLKRAIGEVPRSGTKLPAVPIRVSSGEYAVPPEKANAIGYDKLQALVDAYHVPAAVQRRMK